jgi:glutamate formiminotransferase
VLTAPLNLSEGRRSLAEEIGTTAGRSLLDIHSDSNHNRSVLTLGGENTEEAVRAIAAEAVAMLDLRAHSGAHPRLGVVDVVPFVPFDSRDLSPALTARDDFARWAAAELEVPVFIYGPDLSLPDIRRRAFVGMAPHLGPMEPHPTAGAICAGARGPMLAWNAWLEAGNATLAKAIASGLRKLPGVRSLAMELAGRHQVSCNLIDPTTTPPHVVYDEIAAKATVERCELVGLLPDAVLRLVPQHRWAQLDLSVEQTLEYRLGG